MLPGLKEHFGVWHSWCFSAQMKSATLQQTNVTQEEQQPSLCGRSLSSNYAPLNLENKLLAQTSTLMPQSSRLLNLTAKPTSPSLQPSSLSSTSSSLLCTSAYSSSFTSPLLRTENTLLSSPSCLTTASCLTSVVSGDQASTSLPSTPLLVHSARDEDAEGSSQVMQSCSGETSTVSKMLQYSLTIPLFSNRLGFILINTFTLIHTKN